MLNYLDISKMYRIFDIEIKTNKKMTAFVKYSYQNNQIQYLKVSTGDVFQDTAGLVFTVKSVEVSEDEFTGDTLNLVCDGQETVRGSFDLPSFKRVYK